MEKPKATVGSNLAHLFQEAQTYQLPKVLASWETLEVGFGDGFFTLKKKIIPRGTVGQSMAAEADSKALVSLAIF